MDEAGCYLSAIGGQEANGLDKRFIVAAVAAEGGGSPIRRKRTRPFPPPFSNINILIWEAGEIRSWIVVVGGWLEGVLDGDPRSSGKTALKIFDPVFGIKLNFQD